MYERRCPASTCPREIDAPLVEKLFLTDYSGFFAVGLLIYQFYRGRRGPVLYGLLALSIGTAARCP